MNNPEPQKGKWITWILVALGIFLTLNWLDIGFNLLRIIKILYENI